MTSIRRIALLGATGSIGRSTLSVIRSHPDKLKLSAVSAHSNTDLLKAIVAEFKPEIVVITGDRHPKLTGDVKLLEGIDGLVEAARDASVNVVLVATSGTAGIFPTIAALREGKRVALANKETLVAFGEVVRRTLQDFGGEIVPVDSEHSSLFQLLQERKDEVEKIVLTASGGPFRTLKMEELKEIRPEEALKHPTWSMGKKITIDSATLMNKALEIVEANRLFDVEPERIEVVIHPESIIHGAVMLRDGSFLAHLSPPDMRVPIQYALSYPERWENPVRFAHLRDIGSLHFEGPDTEKFPALLLGYRALKEGGTMPAVLNAANEVAVEAFLRRKIPFTAIAEVVRRVMDLHKTGPAYPLERVLEVDYWARQVAESQVANWKFPD